MKWNDGVVMQEFDAAEFRQKMFELGQVVNGRTGFGDVTGRERNLDGVVLQHTFTLANTEESLTHSLGSIPLGYITLRTSNGGVIYDGVSPTTNQEIWLRSTTAANTVTIFIAR